jgi:hypothetical protein
MRRRGMRRTSLGVGGVGKKQGHTTRKAREIEAVVMVPLPVLMLCRRGR